MEEESKSNPSVYAAADASVIEPAQEIGWLVKSRMEDKRLGTALQQFAVGEGFVDRWGGEHSLYSRRSYARNETGMGRRHSCPGRYRTGKRRCLESR